MSDYCKCDTSMFQDKAYVERHWAIMANRRKAYTFGYVSGNKHRPAWALETAAKEAKP